MEYSITHSKRQGFLTAFHFGGGWNIGEVFPFSSNSRIVFHSEQEVKDKIAYIIKTCKEQTDRWGEWSVEALAFANKLSYKQTQ